MRISDWSSDVCSSDLVGEGSIAPRGAVPDTQLVAVKVISADGRYCCASDVVAAMDWVATHHPDVAAVNLSLGSDDTFPGHCEASTARSEEHTSELQSLMRISYAVFCLKKKIKYD